MRNERQMHIYSFEGGERFEPDYVLFLQKDKTDGFEQFQVFIEPKGAHLVENDKWKEDFLLQLKESCLLYTSYWQVVRQKTTRKEQKYFTTQLCLQMK